MDYVRGGTLKYSQLMVDVKTGQDMQSYINCSSHLAYVFRDLAAQDPALMLLKCYQNWVLLLDHAGKPLSKAFEVHQQEAVIQMCKADACICRRLSIERQMRFHYAASKVSSAVDNSQ